MLVTVNVWQENPRTFCPTCVISWFQRLMYPMYSLKDMATIPQLPVGLTRPSKNKSLPDPVFPHLWVCRVCIEYFLRLHTFILQICNCNYCFPVRVELSWTPEHFLPQIWIYKKFWVTASNLSPLHHGHLCRQWASARVCWSTARGHWVVEAFRNGRLGGMAFKVPLLWLWHSWRCEVDEWRRHEGDWTWELAEVSFEA